MDPFENIYGNYLGTYYQRSQQEKKEREIISVLQDLHQFLMQPKKIHLPPKTSKKEKGLKFRKPSTYIPRDEYRKLTRSKKLTVNQLDI